MRALIILLAGAGALWGVDGTVRNGTSDKPQPNAEVTLLRIGSNGPEMVDSTKSAPDGTFSINSPAASAPGPRLLQVLYDGVTYSRMIPPGSPSQNLQIQVYQSSNKPGMARITTHMMLLEPVDGQLNISESFVWNNDGKVTYNGPAHGTLRFWLPPGAEGKVEVGAIAPNSVSVRQTATETNQANVYQIGFPIKPGESRIDLTYHMPFASPGTFVSKVLYADPNTKILAPTGVTLSGTGVQSVGQEPRTKATVYNVDGPDLRIEVQGKGTLARENDDQQSGDSDQGSQLSELLPQLYNKTSPVDGPMSAVASVKWILLLIFGMLALAFVYLYRKQPGANVAKAPASATQTASPTARAANERGR